MPKRPSFEEIPLKQLEKCCASAGFSFSQERLDLLKRYLEVLVQWNQVMNLVGPKSWKLIFNKLVVDSFHLRLFLQKFDFSESHTFWDIGAGAGLPGAPLRMLWDKGQYWLIEAREKRALFLTTVLARIPLPKTYVYHGRAEAAFVNKLAPRPNAIISRAFMPWKSLLTFVKDMLPVQGKVILLLQEQDAEDVPFGWREEDRYAYAVNGSKRLFIALVKKASESELSA